MYSGPVDQITFANRANINFSLPSVLAALSDHFKLDLLRCQNMTMLRMGTMQPSTDWATHLIGSKQTKSLFHTPRQRKTPPLYTFQNTRLDSIISVRNWLLLLFPFLPTHHNTTRSKLQTSPLSLSGSSSGFPVTTVSIGALKCADAMRFPKSSTPSYLLITYSR